MATLLNGMTLLAITPEWKWIVRGSAHVLAVLFDVRGSRIQSTIMSNPNIQNSRFKSALNQIFEKSQ